ncbi:MAG TPA: hypothetical protein VF618_09230 [Thermoanaerobaculia bacterium]
MDGQRKPERKSAGLPLSVGRASFAVRALIAFIFLVTGAICLGGGILVARASRLTAIALIVPLGLIAILAASYILAPFSRFGVWLDHFLPRIREPHIALLVATVIWGVATVIVL